MSTAATAIRTRLRTISSARSSHDDFDFATEGGVANPKAKDKLIKMLSDLKRPRSDHGPSSLIEKFYERREKHDHQRWSVRYGLGVPVRMPLRTDLHANDYLPTYRPRDGILTPRSSSPVPINFLGIHK